MLTFTLGPAVDLGDGSVEIDQPLSADTSAPSIKGKNKQGFKLPTLEGTIDLRPPSGHIGLDADLSPSSSRSGTLGVGGT